MNSSTQLINSAEVCRLFGKNSDWFLRDRVRKSLYARGFPRPVIRGRWLASAVMDWLQREGNLPHARLA
jgi:predicted DNA-binding transcriptional regulator AlpA